MRKDKETQETPVQQDEAVAAGQEETLEAEEVVGEVAEPNPEQDLIQAREELAELRDQLLRTYAEQENFKKRMERERSNSLKYAGEPIFKEILPAVDNLERAITQGVVEGADAATNLQGLLEGVELTLKSLVTALEKFEVRPMKSVGEPFDPTCQEALTMVPSETVPASHVSSEFEKGYIYKDRLLRAAKVIVSSGKGENG